MRARWIAAVVGMLAVIVFTASWRVGSPSKRSATTDIDVVVAQNKVASVSRKIVASENSPASATIDFQTEFQELLDHFNTDDRDPFARKKRAAAFQERIEQISPARFASAFEAIACIEGRGSSEAGRDLLARVVQRWAELEPSAAAAGVREFAGDSTEACRRVATVWARSDAGDAIGWANNLADASARDAALTAIAEENASIDPITTLTLLPKLPNLPEGIVGDAMRAWMEHDPAAATNWAENLDAGPLRDRAILGIAAGTSDSDPVEAATLAIEELPPSQQRDNLLLGIVQRWAAKDYGSAAAWVSEFPQSDLRDRALRELKRVATR